MKILYIKWLDACFQEREHLVDELDPNFVLESVGHFVRETKKHITLAQDYSVENKTYRYTKHIPKVLIIKRKIIKT